jgi:hypothetical protein
LVPPPPPLPWRNEKLVKLLHRTALIFNFSDEKKAHHVSQRENNYYLDFFLFCFVHAAIAGWLLKNERKLLNFIFQMQSVTTFSS